MNQGIETQQIEARAAGGPVNAGQPYLVGEQGPEVIVPNGSGTVIPNGQSPSLYAGLGQAHANLLLSSAEEKYKYLKQHNLDVTVNHDPNKQGYAETFPIGETGSPDWPTPAGSDNNRNRVEVYQSGNFSPSDLAAEGLHVDPYAKQTRFALTQTLTPNQIATLKNNAGDYQMSIDAGQDEAKAMRNTVDSAMRGYAFNQDQNLVNEGMNYSPKQMAILNDLKSYVESGKKPNNATSKIPVSDL